MELHGNGFKLRGWKKEDAVSPEFDTILRQVFDIQFVAILVFAIQIL